FAAFVLDQLAGLGGVSARRMFGGHGLYLGDGFFGIIHDGRLYFRTDEGSRPDYEKAGMKPFRPNAKQTLKNYLEVPVDVIEKPATLREWALRAAAAQPAAGPAQPGRRR
ncbi:MAG TPA: TfoX/Sxy family protein, partial [Burkholderiales bacterium]|nr:TfoX/Sxy family protein [Burkholderiales bacterium]